MDITDVITSNNSVLIKERVVEICKDFIGIHWLDLKSDDFKITQISGGFNHWQYLCEIAANIEIPTVKDVPRKVLLRIYGPIMTEKPEKIVTDSVISILLAERGMGPKVYGTFIGGRVGEYIESRHLLVQDVHQPQVSREIARTMARFHKMSAPLVKKTDWMFSFIESLLKDVEAVLHNNSLAGGNGRFCLDVLKILEGYRFAEEFKTLKNLLLQVESPIIFCHNDMHAGNILLRNEGSTDKPEGKLVAIDYEYMNYNYRGFDIGNHLSDWGYDYYNVTEFPFYKVRFNDYPNRTQQEIFVTAYMSEMGFKMDSSDSINSLEHIIKEANVFGLASHFMWGFWSILEADTSTMEFGYLEYAIDRFEDYFIRKQQVIAEYALKCDQIKTKGKL